MRIRDEYDRQQQTSFERGNYLLKNMGRSALWWRLQRASLLSFPSWNLCLLKSDAQSLYRPYDDISCRQDAVITFVDGVWYASTNERLVFTKNDKRWILKMTIGRSHRYRGSIRVSCGYGGSGMCRAQAWDCPIMPRGKRLSHSWIQALQGGE